MNYRIERMQHSVLLKAGCVLALSLASCTETKTKNIPTPTPPVAVVNEEARDYAQYTNQVWSDEFNATTLDLTKWTCELGAGGWGNNELQSYTNSPDNVFLDGSKLIIRARQQGTSYTSARLITKGKQSFVYGRTDIRAKVPKGKGVWPAIWMLGADIDQNNWPVCGEIDIMELRGSKPREMLSTMHYGSSSATHQYKGTTKQLTADLSDDYHLFTVIRSKNLMRFFLDGQEYYRFTNTDVGSYAYPFNNPFFVILNVAVGGNFDGNPDGTATFPQQMEVDYVRHYQYAQ